MAKPPSAEKIATKNETIQELSVASVSVEEAKAKYDADNTPVIVSDFGNVSVAVTKDELKKEVEKTYLKFDKKEIKFKNNEIYNQIVQILKLNQNGTASNSTDKQAYNIISENYFQKLLDSANKIFNPELLYQFDVVADLFLKNETIVDYKYLSALEEEKKNFDNSNPLIKINSELSILITKLKSEIANPPKSPKIPKAPPEFPVMYKDYIKDFVSAFEDFSDLVFGIDYFDDTLIGDLIKTLKLFFDTIVAISINPFFVGVGFGTAGGFVASKLVGKMIKTQEDLTNNINNLVNVVKKYNGNYNNFTKEANEASKWLVEQAQFIFIVFTNILVSLAKELEETLQTPEEKLANGKFGSSPQLELKIENFVAAFTAFAQKTPTGAAFQPNSSFEDKLEVKGIVDSDGDINIKKTLANKILPKLNLIVKKYKERREIVKVYEQDVKNYLALKKQFDDFQIIKEENTKKIVSLENILNLLKTQIKKDSSLYFTFKIQNIPYHVSYFLNSPDLNTNLLQSKKSDLYKGEIPKVSFSFDLPILTKYAKITKPFKNLPGLGNYIPTDQQIYLNENQPTIIKLYRTENKVEDLLTDLFNEQNLYKKLKIADGLSFYEDLEPNKDYYYFYLAETPDFKVSPVSFAPNTLQVINNVFINGVYNLPQTINNKNFGPLGDIENSLFFTICSYINKIRLVKDDNFYYIERKSLSPKDLTELKFSRFFREKIFVEPKDKIFDLGSLTFQTSQNYIKVRLTSKKTNKKIDINLQYTIPNSIKVISSDDKQKYPLVSVKETTGKVKNIVQKQFPQTRGEPLYGLRLKPLLTLCEYSAVNSKLNDFSKIHLSGWFSSAETETVKLMANKFAENQAQITTPVKPLKFIDIKNFNSKNEIKLSNFKSEISSIISAANDIIKSIDLDQGDTSTEDYKKWYKSYGQTFFVDTLNDLLDILTPGQLKMDQESFFNTFVLPKITPNNKQYIFTNLPDYELDLLDISIINEIPAVISQKNNNGNVLINSAFKNILVQPLTAIKQKYDNLNKLYDDYENALSKYKEDIELTKNIPIGLYYIQPNDSKLQGLVLEPFNCQNTPFYFIVNGAPVFTNPTNFTWELYSFFSTPIKDQRANQVEIFAIDQEYEKFIYQLGGAEIAIANSIRDGIKLLNENGAQISLSEYEKELLKDKYGEEALVSNDEVFFELFKLFKKISKNFYDENGTSEPAFDELGTPFELRDSFLSSKYLLYEVPEATVTAAVAKLESFGLDKQFYEVVLLRYSDDW